VISGAKRRIRIGRPAVASACSAEIDSGFTCFSHVFFMDSIVIYRLGGAVADLGVTTPRSIPRSEGANKTKEDALLLADDK